MAFPAANLVIGATTATGLTTAGSYTRDGVEHLSTTTPEEFTGVYRGTVEDPAGDLLIFELQGSRITDEDGEIDAGIWAGISGSPLYAADGALIGSVSYTFGGYQNTNYAGVTPAADIYALLDHPTSAAHPAKVTLDAAERTSLTAQGLPTAAAQAGLRRLAPVSTLAGTRGMPERLQRRIAKQSRMARPMANAGTSAQDQEIEIVPGGSVAFAASRGTMPLYSVGTAVAVCGDVVLGYGHAGNFAPASFTMHGASTALVQPNAGSSFKLANIGAPVGSQTHDGLNGVRGTLGALPASTEVVVNTTGLKSSHTTNFVSEPSYLTYITANQIARDAILSVDSTAGGSADVAWNIQYTRAGGQTGTLSGAQQYSSEVFLSDLVYMDVVGVLDALVANPFEEIQINKVTVDMAIRTTVNNSRVSAVQYKSGKRWLSPKPNARVTLPKGKPLLARVTVSPTTYRSTSPTVRKTFTFKTTPRARRGTLQVVGAAFDFEYFYFEEMGSAQTGRTIDELLSDLNEVTASDTVHLTLRANGSKAQKKTWRTGTPTSGEWYSNLIFR